MASKVLIDHFNVIIQISENAGQIDFIKEEEVDETNHIYEKKIDDLNVSVRLFNALKRAGIYKIGDLMKLKEEDIIKFRNLGQVIKRVKECLSNMV